MPASSPSALSLSSFSADPEVPITFAPSALAVCSAATPTPAEMPVTSSHSPDLSLPWAISMSCTTMKARGIDPASSQVRFFGTTIASRASMSEYSENDPAQRPMTRSPVLKPVTPAPSLATSPAPSAPAAFAAPPAARERFSRILDGSNTISSHCLPCGAGEPQNVHAGVGAVDRVDVAALVDLDVVGLDRGLAALFRPLADAALLGPCRDGGNVIGDLPRTKGIADVECAHPGVEVGKEHDALVIHGSEALVRGVRAEAPAAAAEVAALLGHGPARHSDRPRFVGDVDEDDHLARLLALVAEGFAGHDDEIARARLLVLRELRDLHAEHREGGVRAELRREVQARDLRIDEVPGRGFLRTAQELLPVDDLQYAFAVRAVGEIDAIVFRAGRNGSVQRARRGTARARLVPWEPEVADEDGPCRIGEVVDLRMAPRPPALDARNEKRDARVAFPPALVRALELVDDGREARRLRRVGHVPDLVRGVAVVAQQIHLALVAFGELG